MRCGGCGREFDVEEEPGGLLFSPPAADGSCFKHHVCPTCYPALAMFLARIDRTTIEVEDVAPPSSGSR